MDRPYLEGVFISWMKDVPRSRGIAEALRVRDFYIESMKGVPLVLLPLRYLIQTLQTLAVLWRERPKLIITMNPPIVLPLIVYLAATLLGAEFIIDSHTTAITGKWRRVLFLHRFLSRRALVTLVTNDPLRREVASWGAAAMVLEDRLPRLHMQQVEKKSCPFSIGVLSARAEDEPFNAILAAAARLPAYQFFITGRIGRQLAGRSKQLPGNVTLTGFLRGAEYVSLLNTVDALMVLDTEDFTMLCGAYEAVAVEKPLITSDWPVLREYFSLGTLYVNNTPESIQGAVKKAAQCQAQLRAEMGRLKNSLERRWNGRLWALCSHISSALGPGAMWGIEEDVQATVNNTGQEAISIPTYAQAAAGVTAADR